MLIDSLNPLHLLLDTGLQALSFVLHTLHLLHMLRHVLIYVFHFLITGDLLVEELVLTSLQIVHIVDPWVKSLSSDLVQM